MNEEKTKWRFSRNKKLESWFTKSIFAIVLAMIWYVFTAPYPIPSILGIGELRVGLMAWLGIASEEAFWKIARTAA